MMRRIILVLFVLFFCCNAFCGTKKAFAVFIGEYPETSGWNRIASQNDKSIVLRMLLDNGFRSSDIIILEESGATYDAIIGTLQWLVSSVKPGDQIYIHFSCHGQQITDQDGDEALADPGDRYDEALVPYDAAVAYKWNGYTGDRHLTDDVLNLYFSRIQKEAGSNGCLLVVNDACHSGGIEMDEIPDEIPSHRGSFDAFEQPFVGRTGKPMTHPVTWISISACKSFQTNYEVEIEGLMYGRLSYAMSRCFKSGMNAGDLLQAISDEYKALPMPNGKVQTLNSSVPENMKTKKMFSND